MERQLSITGINAGDGANMNFNGPTSINLNSPVSEEQNTNFQLETSSYYLFDSPKPMFTGRQFFLLKIHEALQQCKSDQVWDKRLVVLNGPGGIGKSQLAQKYATDYSKDYKGIVWIDAENFISLSNSFQKIAKRLDIPSCKELVNQKSLSVPDTKTISEHVYTFLSENCASSLFIFDNTTQIYDSIREFGIDPYLPKQFVRNCPFFLATSRTSVNELKFPSSKIIAVDYFQEDESVEYLKTYLKIESSAAADELLRKLAKTLNNHPIILALAAGCIYTTDSNEVFKNLEKLSQNATQNITQSVIGLAEWKFVIDNIALQENGKTVLDMLYILCYLPTNGIKFSYVASIHNYLTTHESRQSSDIKKILTFNLLVVLKEEEAETYIHIHRIVQYMAREDLQSNKNFLYLTNLANYFALNDLNDEWGKQASILVHKYLKEQNWPQDSLKYSILIFGRAFKDSFKDEQAFSILYEIWEEIQANQPFLGIESSTLFNLGIYHYYLNSKGGDKIRNYCKQNQTILKQQFLLAIKSIMQCVDVLSSSDSSSESCESGPDKIWDKQNAGLHDEFSQVIVERTLENLGRFCMEYQQEIFELLAETIVGHDTMCVSNEWLERLWSYGQNLSSPMTYMHVLKKAMDRSLSRNSLDNLIIDDAESKFTLQSLLLHFVMADLRCPFETKSWKKKDFMAAFLKERCLDNAVQVLEIAGTRATSFNKKEIISVFEMLTVLAHQGRQAHNFRKNEKLLVALQVCTQLLGDFTKLQEIYYPEVWTGFYRCIVVWYAIFKNPDQGISEFARVFKEFSKFNSFLKQSSSRNYLLFISSIRDDWFRKKHKKIFKAFSKSNWSSSSVECEIAKHLTSMFQIDYYV